MHNMYMILVIAEQSIAQRFQPTSTRSVATWDPPAAFGRGGVHMDLHDLLRGPTDLNGVNGGNPEDSNEFKNGFQRNPFFEQISDEMTSLRRTPKRGSKKVTFDLQKEVPN